uniref:Thioredoxin n=1 Tax=candidate division WOR-3 bacterium TaxID=2052148 RepID=A0A7C4CAN9_UNCW3
MRIAVTLLAGLLLTLAACPTKPQPPAPTLRTDEPAPAETVPVRVAAGESAQPTPPKTTTKPTTPQADTPEPVAAPADSARAPELPKLWDFFATWCPPCKQQAPIIEELAREYQGRIEIVSIDTDRNPALAEKFKIKAIPTLVFLDANQRELSRNVGFLSKEGILAKFREHGFIQ